MLSEGAEAPAVSLPGYVDGERTRVDLDEYVGEGIVVLAFYPSDFNPACSMQEADLGDLDLFTMQKDVSVFAVSPDSTYSHEAFAERYSLNVPLLSDPDGEAAAAYDVHRETDVGEPLPKRAVFVVDHRGTVQYAWATDDLEEQVDVDPVKRAVGDIGGDETAVERYRVGYDHYVAGQEAFEAAMAEYEDREWLDARARFEDAEPELATAADHFDTAIRFAETGAFETVADCAEEKADTLQHAANWLTESADALGSGRGKAGKEYREDAERLLEAASDLPDPPAGDTVSLSDDGVAFDESVDPAQYRVAARQGGEAVDADLGVDDEAFDAAPDVSYDEQRDGEGDAVDGDLEMDLDAIEADDGDGDGGGGGEGDGDGDATADGDRVTDNDGATVGDAATGAGVGDAGDGSGGSTQGVTDDGDETDEEVEQLDLADPTEGDDDEEDDERADWDIPGR